MFLRRYVIEVITAIEGMAKEQLVESPDPILEGVGKFLIIHYNYRDMERIQRISMGYTDEKVNRLLKDCRDTIQSC